MPSPPASDRPQHKTAIVIPVRYGSKRFPGKALAEIAGEPMVWHVFARAREARVGEVLVATDDERIERAIQARGGAVVRTSSRCRNGTERVAEVARSRPDIDLWIDLQGDEPLIDPATIAALARAMTPPWTMGTAAFPLDGDALLGEPSVVKVELHADGRARAFWRLPPAGPRAERDPLHHAGIYAFQRDTLLRIADLAPTKGERDHSLEQLRALENGIPIRVVEVPKGGPGVNTPVDLDAVRRVLMDTLTGGAT